MAAGGPGDHPLTDILKYNFDVYNKKCDQLVREISKFVSIQTLYEMFDWIDNLSATEEQLIEFERALSHKLDELRSLAESNGWEKK